MILSQDGWRTTGGPLGRTVGRPSAGLRWFPPAARFAARNLGSGIFFRPRPPRPIYHCAASEVISATTSAPTGWPPRHRHEMSEKGCAATARLPRPMAERAPDRTRSHRDIPRQTGTDRVWAEEKLIIAINRLVIAGTTTQEQFEFNAQELAFVISEYYEFFAVVTAEPRRKFRRLRPRRAALRGSPPLFEWDQPGAQRWARRFCRHARRQRRRRSIRRQDIRR